MARLLLEVQILYLRNGKEKGHESATGEPMIKRVPGMQVQKRGLLRRWHVNWKGQWYRLSGVSSVCDQVFSGDYSSDIVYTLRIGGRPMKGQPIQFAFYKGVWYQDTSSIDPDDLGVLVKAQHEMVAQKIERAKRYLGAVGRTSSRTGREPIPREVQILVWQRDQGKCVRCGSNANLEFDHIIPLSKGGANSARNIQLLCQTCNRSKGARIGV